MLEEPLNHIGVTRTEDDNFSIELCLTLLRNVLNIKDPTPGMVTSLGDHYVQMHEQVVELMQDALLLDILLLLAQDVHARENAKLNLLLVEIFHCVIRDQEPGAVIAVHRAKVQKGAIGKGSHVRPSSAPNPKGSLLGVLAKEKTMRGNVSGQMHRCVLAMAENLVLYEASLSVDGGAGIPHEYCRFRFVDRLPCLDLVLIFSFLFYPPCQPTHQIWRHPEDWGRKRYNGKDYCESVQGSRGFRSPGCPQENEDCQCIHTGRRLRVLAPVLRKVNCMHRRYVGKIRYTDTTCHVSNIFSTADSNSENPDVYPVDVHKLLERERTLADHFFFPLERVRACNSQQSQSHLG